ncbi:MAG TPA: DNA polymerase IV [Polyangiaceae bacterium]|nr:DNA polymerase IV [Polyangiaceae bacterium]
MDFTRWVLHADMDAFYASIEQRDRPELRNKPVIVGAASARGVVAAASYEARKFGVRSAMPGFRAKQLCPDGIFLAGNMPHYAAVSAEIHEVFTSFTPQVEPIALDEAFLDISGSLGLFGQPKQLAERLKQAVFEKTALNVSVGIAPNKLVAKIACTFGKPNGLTVVEPHAVIEFLRPLPIRRLWGVGPVLAERLQSLGIRTFADLSDFDPRKLDQAIGRRALELQALARGEDHRPVEADRIPKSYGEESTFERDVSARDVVTAALTAHAEAVARRVRRDSFRGRTVTLKIKLGIAKGTRIARGANPFGEEEPLYPLLTRSRTLPEPTDSGSTIREVAVSLWDEAQVQTPVRLLGVSLSNLVAREGEQLDLFARPRKDRLGPTLDAIAERFGPNAISRAVDAPGKVTPSGRKKRGEP